MKIGLRMLDFTYCTVQCRAKHLVKFKHSKQLSILLHQDLNSSLSQAVDGTYIQTSSLPYEVTIKIPCTVELVRLWSFKTGGLSWQCSLETDFTGTVWCMVGRTVEHRLLLCHVT